MERAPVIANDAVVLGILMAMLGLPGTYAPILCGNLTRWLAPIT